MKRPAFSKDAVPLLARNAMVERDVVLTKGEINAKFMAENIQAESDAAKNLKSLPR